MARQIIVMDRRPSGWPGSHTLRAVFWLAVPTGQEIPVAGFTSAVKGTDQPDATEQQALADGTVMEFVVNYSMPSNYSLPNAKAFLEASYAQCVAAFASATQFGTPGQFYGMKWDGTTWTA